MDMAQEEYLNCFVPDGPQLSEYLYNDWSYMNAIIGPLGSGKTYGSAQKILDAMMDAKPCTDGVKRSKWYAVRNTAEDLKRTTIEDYFAVVDKDLGRWNASSMRHDLDFEDENGTPILATMQFLAFDLPDSIKKFRGSQLTGIWFNEIKELDRSIVMYGLSRTGRYPKNAWFPLGEDGHPDRGWYGGIGDSNRQYDDHWLTEYEEGIADGRVKNWNIRVQPGGVVRVGKENRFVINPKAENLSNLDKNYYLNQMQGAKASFIAVELANEIGIHIDGEAVHPEYNDLVHSPAEKKINYRPSLPVYLGVDGGRKPAAAFFQLVNGGLEVFDEFCADGIGASLFAPNLVQYARRKWGIKGFQAAFCDPSSSSFTESSPVMNDEEQSFMDIMIANGIPAEPAPVANQNTMLRRKALTDPLTTMRGDGQPRMLIARRCKVLRKGLSGKFYYRRLQVRGDAKFSQEPEKNDWSHVCEGLEYGALGVGEGMAFTPTKETARREARRNWKGELR